MAWFWPEQSFSDVGCPLILISVLWSRSVPSLPAAWCNFVDGFIMWHMRTEIWLEIPPKKKKKDKNSWIINGTACWELSGGLHKTCCYWLIFNIRCFSQWCFTAVGVTMPNKSRFQVSVQFAGMPSLSITAVLGGPGFMPIVSCRQPHAKGQSSVGTQCFCSALLPSKSLQLFNVTCRIWN